MKYFYDKVIFISHIAQGFLRHSHFSSTTTEVFTKIISFLTCIEINSRPY